MANEKKFLDQAGVQYLWSQLSMEDYPNNETLIAVLNAIDQTKADKDELFSGSWNDLNDKPFGEELSTTVIYSGNIEMPIIMTDPAYVAAADIPVDIVDVPDKLIVTVDETTYEIITGEYSTFSYKGRNIHIEIYDNTLSLHCESFDGDFTIENIVVEAVTETVNTIDSKYLTETYVYIDEQINTHTHSWNDLTDKPFETNPVSERVLWYEGSWRLVGGFEDSIGHLSEIADKDVVVTFDGTEYESHCYSSKEDDHDYYIIGVGNHYISQYDYSDEPLFVLPSNMKGPFEVKIEVIEVTNMIPDDIISDNIARTVYVNEQISSHTHSWNDLTDKPFGETESWTLITSLEFEGTYTNLNLLDTSVKNIKFVFDGEEYFFDFYGDGTYGGDGYPFEFSAEFSGFAVGYVLYITCGDGFHTVEIYAGETTVKPIDAKYLPDNNYASQEYVDGQLSTKSDSNHEHNELYYTETEVNNLLNGKVNTSELDNYYTKTEVEQFHDEITDYVDDEVAALVNAAPETLDTLGELATAFEENKEVVEALDASITNKQDKISDTLILVDTVTGKQYKIQIQNGQLVSFEV